MQRGEGRHLGCQVPEGACVGWGRVMVSETWDVEAVRVSQCTPVGAVVAVPWRSLLVA